MTRKVNLLTHSHTSVSRNYLERMLNDKVKCSQTALNFEKDYWDGSRKFGYGGYVYDGRWKKIAELLIERYNLNKDSKILDLGCGKAHLLYELKNLLGCETKGLDISRHALKTAPEGIQDSLERRDLRDILPYEDSSWDLVLSVMVAHNFEIPELSLFLGEMNRVSKNAYLAVESYRNVNELFNLQCWALTCKSFFSEREWHWLLERFGYEKDYELLYFK